MTSTKDFLDDLYMELERIRQSALEVIERTNEAASILKDAFKSLGVESSADVSWEDREGDEDVEEDVVDTEGTGWVIVDPKLRGDSRTEDCYYTAEDDDMPWSPQPEDAYLFGSTESATENAIDLWEEGYQAHKDPSRKTRKKHPFKIKWIDKNDLKKKPKAKPSKKWSKG